MTAKRIKPPRPPSVLAISIERELAAKPLTVIDVAAMLDRDQAAVDSCMRSLVRNGKVVRLRHAVGTWAKYRLAGGSA